MRSHKNAAYYPHTQNSPEIKSETMNISHTSHNKLHSRSGVVALAC